MMTLEAVTPFVEQYGYLMLLVVGFVEYVGVPIASMPVLLVAGAMIGVGTLAPVPAVAFVVVGALLGDAVWFGFARVRGERIVNRVCGITSNPRACIYGVTSRIERLGPAYIIPAKFIPGTGNLIAAAAGFAGMRARTFFLADALALTLWASVYMLVGRVFADQVEVGMAWLLGTVRIVAVVALSLVAAAALVRWVKVRHHRRGHAQLAAAATATSGPSTPEHATAL